MSVNRARLYFGFVVPNVDEEMLTSLYATTALHQQAEKLEFRGGEFNGSPVDGHFVTLGIEDDLTDLKTLYFFGRNVQRFGGK